MTAQYSECIVIQGQQVAGNMEKVLVQGESLLTELRLIKNELKTNGESAKKIAEATANNKAISESTKNIISALTDAACINWMSVGMVVSFF